MENSITKDSLDSVRKARSKDDLFNDIRALMSADVEGKNVIILVEGPDDELFIESILPEYVQNIVCFESYSGVEGLLETLDAVKSEKYSPRVIGIRDKDYSNPSTYPPRLFSYDYCCLEMMLLHNDFVQRRVRENYEVADERPFIPMFYMRMIAPYSMLRKWNEDNCAGINFGRSGVLAGCGKNRFPNIELLFSKCNHAELYNEFSLKSQELTDDDLWDITQGHDICSLIGRFVSLGKRAVLGEAGLREFMFGLYRFEDFKNTKLFLALFNYFSENNFIPENMYLSISS